ncbi:TPA: recombinase family protein [Klebsiella pneumoniae subsp. pneumoniae]|nr:recombinase family protein [Klebsiella quasipneumoniae subsp. similipneumoniae]HDT5907211.1 recombinase family protein [Klebsiella michiganensis]HDT5924089.1 recombinase family protein [Klebsiella pneumoniae subsp. pneumoniae]
MKDKPMIGYARVSTDDQDLTNQRAELHAAGCTRIFAEKITGTHAKRPELGRMLDHLLKDVFHLQVEQARVGEHFTLATIDALLPVIFEHGIEVVESQGHGQGLHCYCSGRVRLCPGCGRR